MDDDATLKANREGFSHYQLRPRRLVDTTKIDMSVDLFGTRWETPIVLAPSGTLFHAEGPLPVARAAQQQKTLQILGGVQERNHPIGEVMKARGGPVWYQLYASQDWTATRRHRQTGRERGLSGAGLDGGHSGRPQSGNRAAAAASRHASMFELSRHRRRSSVRVRRARTR